MTNRAEHRSAPGDTEGRVGVGWRVFQVLALIAGVSYIIGWVAAGPASYFDGIVESPTALSSYTSVISFLSPIVALAAILLAVDPHRLKLLMRRSPAARAVAVLLLVLTVGWLLNGMFTPMYEKLVTVPMNESKVLPIPGGVFLHMVLQHWFMSIAVLTLALMPSRFSALIANTRPASLQCAVVRC